MYTTHQEAKGNQTHACSRLLIRDTVHLGMTSESHRFSHVLVLVVSGKSPLLLAAEDDVTVR